MRYFNRKISRPDIIFVPMKNIGIGSSVEDIRQTTDFLSKPSRYLMDAVAQHAARFPGKTYILLSGKTAGPDFPSESKAGKTYLEKHYAKKIARVMIVIEDDFSNANSLNTVENAKVAKQWLEQRGITEAGLLTIGYHQRRTRQIFKQQGINIVDAITADSVLKKVDRQKYKEVLLFQFSPKVTAERIKEALGLLVSMFDPQGSLSSRLVRQQRGK